MSRRPAQLRPRPQWSTDQFESDRLLSINAFREERLTEPLEEYLNQFDEIQGAVEDLMEQTVDLSIITANIADLIAKPDLLTAFRYLSGPPLSEDDLKTLADVASLSPSNIRRNPEIAEALAATVLAGIDRKRFPWVAEGREPTSAERDAAVLASSALIATQRIATKRRNEGKREQEEKVRDSLSARGFVEARIPGGLISTLDQAPPAGSFCREVTVGSRKADLVVRLWDTRILPIECKVSNSSINSVKRLNNDAAVKARHWLDDFGSLQVVPAAVLSGVFKLHNLIDAQDRGLTIIWSHRLSDLTDWIDSTRPGS